MTMTARENKIVDKETAPAMPFNEALKRVWAAPPMPHVKKKPAAKAAGQNMLTAEELDALRAHKKVLGGVMQEAFKSKEKPAGLAPTILTPSEREQLRQHAKMLSDLGRKAFSADKKPAAK